MKLSIHKQDIMKAMIFLLPFLSKYFTVLFVIVSIIIYYQEALIAIKRDRLSLLYVLGIIYVFSILFARDKGMAISDAAISILAIVWCIIIIGLIEKGTLSDREMLNSYVYSTFIISFLFAIEKITRIRILGWVNNIELVSRANHFCFYIGGALCICIIRTIKKGIGIRNLFCILVFSLAIIIDTGRGEIVAILISILGVQYLSMKKKGIKKYIVLLLSSLLVLILLLSPLGDQLFGKIGKVFSPEGSFSNRERYYMWQTSLKMFSDNIWGVGAGNWSTVYQSEYNVLTKFADYPHAHNTYIQMLCELGIFGFISFVLLIFHSYRMARQSIKKCNQNYDSIIAYALILYSIVGMMFNHPLYNNKTLFLFFTIIGIAIASKRKYMISGGNIYECITNPVRIQG